MKPRFKTWTVLTAVLVALNIVMIGCSSGSRSNNNTNNPPPPPPPPPTGTTLNYAVTAIGTNAVVATLPNQVVGLGFSLTAANGTATVNSITVTATGTVDETGFGAATLVEDNNPQNGQADAAELAAPIATVAGGFTANNGTVSFAPTTPISITAGQTRNFLVALDGSALNGSTPAGIAIVGSTVDFQIAANSDIAATGSGSITPGGTFGTNYGPVTVGVHNHLLISEIASGPGTGATSAEFIEIYNPTGQAFQMDNFHLTDVSNNGGAATDDFNYWELVTAGSGPSTKTFGPLNTNATTNDFHARFPAGTLINPGEAIIVAVDGGGFAAAYPGVNPANTQILVLRNAQANQTQILTWDGPAGQFNFSQTALANSVGFSNNGEPVTLFFFDGSGATHSTDIVIDIDVVTHDNGITVGNSQNDKNGVAVDGFDNGTANQADTTTYNAETTLVNQGPLAGGSAVVSLRRVDFTEGTEPRNPASNGFNGHDEMGENCNTTFVSGGTPTPGTVGP